MPQNRPLDTALLACLDALVQEAHVTRAAGRVGIGQPAMSEALARLRKVFNDPLLVRTREGMTPTPRARAAAERAREALRQIEAVVEHRDAFSPATDVREFRLVALNSLAFSLLPRLVRHLGREAPGVRVQFAPADMRRTRDLLEAGECDLVIGYPPLVASGLHVSPLFKLKLVCVARSGHPELRGRITLEQFMATAHVVLGAGPAVVSTIEARVEKALRARRQRREVAVRTPDLMVSLAVVAETDTIAVVPERIAAAFAAPLGLQVMRLPFAVADPTILMIWHERSHRDPAHRWIRGTIRDLVKEF